MGGAPSSKKASPRDDVCRRTCLPARLFTAAGGRARGQFPGQLPVDMHAARLYDAHPRACSSAGRAPDWQSGGQRFEPAQVHESSAPASRARVPGPKRGEQPDGLRSSATPPTGAQSDAERPDQPGGGGRERSGPRHRAAAVGRFRQRAAPPPTTTTACATACAAACATLPCHSARASARIKRELRVIDEVDLRASALHQHRPRAQPSAHRHGH